MLNNARSVKARLFIMFAGCLAGLLLTEGLLVTHRVIKYGHVGWSELIAIRRKLPDDVIGGVGDRWENRLVLHPLFGYTYNPKDKDINNFGFHTRQHISLAECGYFFKNVSNKESLIIGIFGGSFAEMTGGEAEYLEKQLHDVLPSRKPIVVNFAIGGHALPQSAFIYLYFRQLFDIAVFVDGLNELWNYVENNRAGLPPEYAKGIHYIYKLSRQELTPIQFRRTSRIISLKDRINAITTLSLLPILKYSVFVHHVWGALQIYWTRNIAEESLAITKSYDANKNFFDTPDDTILDLAALEWASYHDLIHHAAGAQSAISIHLLQPNPFVPNSKILTPEEHRAVTNSYPINDYVMTGYPKLQARIRALRALGLIAEDLTDIFKTTAGAVWVDAAHTNQTGSRMVMDRIARLIKSNKDLVKAKPLHSEVKCRSSAT